MSIWLPVEQSLIYNVSYEEIYNCDVCKTRTLTYPPKPYKCVTSNFDAILKLKIVLLFEQSNNSHVVNRLNDGLDPEASGEYVHCQVPLLLPEGDPFQGHAQGSVRQFMELLFIILDAPRRATPCRPRRTSARPASATARSTTSRGGGIRATTRPRTTTTSSRSARATRTKTSARRSDTRAR
jgi:hypothetical protein